MVTCGNKGCIGPLVQLNRDAFVFNNNSQTSGLIEHLAESPMDGLPMLWGARGVPDDVNDARGALRATRMAPPASLTRSMLGD